ncbi:hypothetical protein Aperf_G00000003566 [Anoplocephala perfoliata]
MNQQYLNDNRNGYPQSTEQAPYLQNLNQIPFFLYGNYPYYSQNIPNYQNQYYQQQPPAVSQIPAPQQCSGTQFNVNTTPSRTPSVQQFNTAHAGRSQAKLLKISDPDTGRVLDISSLVAHKAAVSEAEGNASSPAVKLVIKDPPSKSVDTQCCHETVDDAQCVHEDKEQPIPPEKTTGFIVASDEDASSHGSNNDVENNDNTSTAIDAESQSLDEPVSEGESSNLNDEKGGSESDAETDDDERTVDLTQKIEKVESEGNIQKYSRDQLISIRSVTDFSQMPPTPVSAVTNVTSSMSKGYSRQGRKLQIRRVLTFNTDVVLDEVDNAYRPTCLSQNEKKEDIKMTLTFLLNHLTATTVQDCLNDIKKLNLKKEDIDTLASAIVTKSGSSVFREAYAKFCKGLVEAKFEGFQDKLTKKLMEQVCTPIHVYLKECNDLIDAKITQSNDEKVKRMFEEDRESTIAGKRENFFGVIEFFSYLFVEDFVLLNNFCDAVRTFSKPKSQDEVLALVKCLRIAGRTLETKQPTLLKTCMAALDNSKVKIEPHVRFAVSDIKDLRKRSWKEAPQLHAVGKTSAVSRLPSTMASRVNDSKTPIDTKNLAVSSSSGRTSFLGPPKAWSEGSKAQRIKTGVVPDSGMDPDIRTASNAKRRGPGQISNIRIDESLTPEGARRDFVDAFNNSDNPTINLLLKESLKPEFVKCVLCKALEGKASERPMFVNILTYLYSKEQLTFDQMVAGFNDSIDFADELDLPKAGEYFGDLLSSMVQSGSVIFTKLAEVFNRLPSMRDKSEALAQCVKSAAKRIGETEVSSELKKTLSSGLPWGEDRSFKDPEFLKRYKLEFISGATPLVGDTAAETNLAAVSNSCGDAEPSVSKSVADPNVDERIDTCLNEMNFDELLTICSQNCKSKDCDEYLKRIFMASRGRQRKLLEPVLPAVKILIESIPEGEKSCLLTLQSSVEKEEFGRWIRAFIEKKMLSPQSLESYIQDKKSLLPYRKVVRDIIARLQP